MQALVTDIITNRLNVTDPTKPVTLPFFERGELSETPILNPLLPSSTTLVNGVDMKSVFDNGREELVRRLIEMTTTRGSVFTVYAIGQAINQSNPLDASTKRPVATQQLKVTFKLKPKNIDGTDFHPATDANGNPTDSNFNPDALNKTIPARFLKPRPL